MSLIAVALLVGAAGCGHEVAGQPSPVLLREQHPDIILISIDSLRADHLGCYGYERPTSPTIDRLAAEGVLFENPISTTSWTLPSHAALFTGLYDSAHGVVDGENRLADEAVTLAEVLRDAGYQTAGFYGGPFLHPSFGLHQGFEQYQSCMTMLREDVSKEEILTNRNLNQGSHMDITGPRTVERFGQWLETADERPAFAFVHLWDVHYDYIPPQPYDEMFDPGYAGSVTATHVHYNPQIHAGMPQRDLEHVVALYDGEIRFTDDTIKQLLEAFFARRQNRDNTLVVITGDHGDEFFEHGSIGHQTTLFDEVAKIPLVICWPGAIDSGLTVPDQVRLIDVLPTILNMAGIADPAPRQGRDLGPLVAGRSLPPQPALLELLCRGQHLRALRTDDYKLMVDERIGEAGLFHLAVDPGETALVSPTGEHASAAESMMADLQRIVAESQQWRQSVSTPHSTPDAQLMKRLKALGYVGGNPEDDQQ